jgi:hypothetical protein
MTVYVDDMAARYGRMLMYHMVADSEDELHAMAARIGLPRRWYQGDHYDVCKAKRAMAVRAGAREITWRQLGRMSIVGRREGRLPTPEEADAVFARRRAERRREA